MNNLCPIYETKNKVVFSISDNMTLTVVSGGVVIEDLLTSKLLAVYPEEIDSLIAGLTQAVDVLKKMNL